MNVLVLIAVVGFGLAAGGLVYATLCGIVKDAKAPADPPDPTFYFSYDDGAFAMSEPLTGTNPAAFTRDFDSTFNPPFEADK